MDTEVLLLISVILLALILVTMVYIALSNKGVLDGFTQVIEELESQKGNRNSDIGEMLEKQQYEKSLNEIEKRIKNKGEHRTLLWYKGQALYYMEHWHESQQAFNRAIELEPGYKEQLKSYMEVLEQKLSETHNKSSNMDAEGASS